MVFEKLKALVNNCPKLYFIDYHNFPSSYTLTRRTTRMVHTSAKSYDCKTTPASRNKYDSSGAPSRAVKDWERSPYLYVIYWALLNLDDLVCVWGVILPFVRTATYLSWTTTMVPEMCCSGNWAYNIRRHHWTLPRTTVLRCTKNLNPTFPYIPPHWGGETDNITNDATCITRNKRYWMDTFTTWC